MLAIASGFTLNSQLTFTDELALAKFKLRGGDALGNPLGIGLFRCPLRYPNQRWILKVNFECASASVCGPQAEQVESRRRDEGTEPECNAAAEPQTEAGAAAPKIEARDERAGNDKGGRERD